MKRAALYTTVALAAFASGFVGTSVVANRAPAAIVAAGGEPCIDQYGHGGYMVSGGHGEPDVCVANGQS